jgi:GNAT superfamily N-acetyltransferase
MHEICFPNDKMYLPSDGFWWIAYKEAEPSAFAGLVYVKDDGKVDKTFGYLVRAGVLKEHRGSGLQRRLIDARIAKARALKMRKLCTSTYDNSVSSNNLISAGFRMYNPNVGWCCDGTNYWHLKLAG